MALQISGNENKKIHLSGTTVEIPNVYNRLEWIAKTDGIGMEIACHFFQDVIFYQNGQGLLCDIPNENININIDPLVEVQDLTAAEKYAKLHFEGLGYDVTIVA